MDSTLARGLLSDAGQVPDSKDAEVDVRGSHEEDSTFVASLGKVQPSCPAATAAPSSTMFRTSARIMARGYRDAAQWRAQHNE